MKLNFNFNLKLHISNSNYKIRPTKGNTFFVVLVINKMITFKVKSGLLLTN